MSLLFAILLTVTLEPPFGEAEAQLLGAPSARTFDLTVEVEGTPAAVIARITGVSGELDPIALVPKGQSSYGQVIRLTAWEDVSISFEYIGADGETTISAPSTLSALGVELESATPTVPTPPPIEETGVDPWLLAGLAAALSAVVLMAFWATGGMSDTFQAKSSDWTYAATAGLPDEQPTEGEDEPVEEPARGS